MTLYRHYNIFMRRTDDPNAADGYGDWGDGYDWFTDGDEAEAVNEFIDHLAEDNDIERTDDSETVIWNGGRYDLKAEEVRIQIEFLGGESRDGVHGCNYMMPETTVTDPDGNTVDLYAEVLSPDSWIGKSSEEISQEEQDRFDAESFEELKKEIISQMEDAGLDPTVLDFGE